MAFVFVPPFEEGDRQTNTDTGVEYVYKDGAWRALGSSISDQFDVLDERYVNIDGDKMTGALQVEKSQLRFVKEDGTNQLRIIPNDGSGADYYTNIYSHNGGGIRFRAAPGNTSDNYGTGIIIETADHTINGVNYTERTSILQLQTPTKDGHAANKWYVDNAIGNIDLDAYLPLTGGTLTGELISTRTDGDDSNYVFSVRAKALETGKQTAFRVTNEGKVKAGHDTSHPFIADQDNDVITQAYLKLYYLPLSGGTMNNGISFRHPSSQTRAFLDFKNDQVANQVSEIIVRRPFNANGGVNSDGTTSPNGTGGLDLRIFANSDQSRLRVMTGSGASTETLRITGGGNGKQIHSFSSIELCGGDSARQTIWAKSGIVGNLSYSGNADSNIRLSWGANKVWIKNSTLDLTGNQIIGIDEPTDTNHAATKNYVDTQVAAIDTSINAGRPPGLRFNFGNGTSAVGVSSFNYYSDSGQLKLRISLNSMDGKWHDGGKTQDFNYGSSQLFSIYDIPDPSQPTRWKITRHGTFSRVDFHANDILVWVTNHYTNGSFTANEKYYITLAGFF